MLDANAVHDTSAGYHERPSRDRLPTLPFDLTEYARESTGPASYAAHPQADLLAAWALDGHVDPSFARATDLLVDISPEDVPFVPRGAEELTHLVNHREAFVVASIDGQSTLDALAYTVDLPAGEVLAIICDLCARGIVELDRTRR
jgi:hypothetical protein